MRVVSETEDEEILGVLSEAVRGAAEKMDQMRAVEGEKLAEDILMRGRLIREISGKIALRAPKVAEIYVEKMRARIAELLNGAVSLPEERILTEAALFADKSNITEELVRLDSHTLQLEKIIAESSQPDGKKLDFLVQEMNREANTIGSKANDARIARLVVELKAEIEKLREQVQNVE
jgi:uncharacterized protein (TIGR00255 family)